MSLKIHVDVVSAEEQIFSGEAEYAVFPGESGELGILPRHAPLLTRVKQGTVRLKLPERDDFELIYVSGGILEVQPELVTLLADTAVRAESLDAAKAMEAKERSEEAKAKQVADRNFAAVEAELAQAISRMRPRNGKRGI